MSDPIHELINGRISMVEFSRGQIYADAPRSKRVYLSGSFNPVHDGHRTLLDAACAARTAHGGPSEGCFELSIGNADKGLLPEDEIMRRVRQFTSADLPVVVTQVGPRSDVPWKKY